MWFSLDRRVREAEIMDDPQLGREEHERALRGLSRLNRASAAAGWVWRPIERLARDRPGRPVHICDVGAGAGDLLIALQQRARRAAVDLRLTGCDISPTAAAYAAQRCREAGVAAEFLTLDALADPLPAADVLVSCLFFHHLSDEQVVLLFRKMAAAAGSLVLVQDLRRCRAGWLLAHAAGQLLTRSRVVHVDGPRSVRAAFSDQEMLDLARQAGLAGCRVRRHWPCRFLCEWRRCG